MMNGIQDSNYNLLQGAGPNAGCRVQGLIQGAGGRVQGLMQGAGGRA